MFSAALSSINDKKCKNSFCFCWIVLNINTEYWRICYFYKLTKPIFDTLFYFSSRFYINIYDHLFYYNYRRIKQLQLKNRVQKGPANLEYEMVDKCTIKIEGKHYNDKIFSLNPILYLFIFVLKIKSIKKNRSLKIHKMTNILKFKFAFMYF